MPFYDYRCDQCNVVWESFQSMKSRHEETCTECRGPAIILPGMQKYRPFHEGFYEHISKEGVHVSSKYQLKELEKVHDVVIPYAHDGG